MADRITFVVFDMDGVLYDKHAGARLRALSALSGRTPREIDDAIFRSDFEARAEAGDPATGDAYLAGFSERLGHKVDRQTWAGIRRDMMSVKPRVFELARRLKRHVDIAMLTNNPILLKETLADCAPEALALFGASAHVSAEFGARKPDPVLYRKICARHGHAPERTAMVDDSRRNIDGAKRAGLTGLLFVNAIVLETHLRRLQAFTGKGRALPAPGRAPRPCG
ncbi:HAD-IA family hydrolase [Breoghania sp. JC706]|uniref:HAD-IA family hydrolase n=1 Tax=Breoghania sp. JC706 TaxID=3117732 RepID=UPI0030082CCD